MKVLPIQVVPYCRLVNLDISAGMGPLRLLAPKLKCLQGKAKDNTARLRRVACHWHCQWQLVVVSRTRNTISRHGMWHTNARAATRTTVSNIMILYCFDSESYVSLVMRDIAPGMEPETGFPYVSKCLRSPGAGNIYYKFKTT